MLAFHAGIQGAVAGFTGSYLSGRVQQELQKPASDVKGVLALQASHLCLLVAETLVFAGMSLGPFGTLTRAVCILTPFAFLPSLAGRQLVVFDREFAKEIAKGVDLIYRAGIVATAVASLILGNPSFAVTALCAFGAESFVEGREAKALLAEVKKWASVFAFLSYTSELFQGEGSAVDLAKMSAVVLGAKFGYDFFSSFSARYQGENDDLVEERKRVDAPSSPVTVHVHNSHSFFRPSFFDYDCGNSYGWPWWSYRRPCYYAPIMRPQIAVVAPCCENTRWVDPCPQPTTPCIPSRPTTASSSSASHFVTRPTGLWNTPFEKEGDAPSGGASSRTHTTFPATCSVTTRSRNSTSLSVTPHHP